MKTIELICKQKINDDGQLVSESYFLNGKLHNEHGPAFNKNYHPNKFKYQAYFLNGELLTIEEWERRVNTSCNGKIVKIDGKKYKLEEL